MGRGAYYGSYRDQGQRVKGSELFVGGLAPSTTESAIHKVFSPCGEIVELRMMKDQTGISMGFCFVRFSTKEAALKAQKDKDGIMLHGKRIGVAPSSDQDSLYFGNIRKEWSSQEFDKLVHQAFKDVVSIDLAMSSSIGGSPSGRKRLNRGFAFVQFSSHAAAARALRTGSGPDFQLGDWHPAIHWAEKKPEMDPKELAKIKVAFVGNLPTNADEDFLKQLFEPLGKVERVALSRKGHSPVGFVHFANRSDLDYAIREIDGKTVGGPRNIPKFKIQVSIVKPVEMDRKRVRNETKRPENKSGLQPSSLNNRLAQDPMDHKSKAPRLANMVPEAVDPYEEAVVTLPSAVKERLLRVLRLGVATRFDVNIHCIASLQKLPESAAIAVLDQFLLSGADKHDKGGYFASLISRHQVDKFGSRSNSSHFPRNDSNLALKEVGLPSLREPLSSQAISNSASRYTSPPVIFPCSSAHTNGPLPSRSNLGYRPSPSSYRDPVSSTMGICPGSLLASSADQASERPRIRFDPFTGQPYKFDPFTGEPILPESQPRNSTKLV